MKKLKSKIVSLALALCLVVPCMFMLTACGNDHTHTLTKVDAVEKTCTTDGNTAYYKCDCGKYFSDEEAKTEIEEDSWVIVKGHTYADEWTYNATHHWKVATCSHSTEKGEYAEHSLTDNVCACGYVAYTVTNVDEWNEVFTGDYLNNGTINITFDYYNGSVVDLSKRETQIMKSTETSMENTVIGGGDEGPQYLIKQGETWIGLVQAGGTWYGREQSPEEVESWTFAGGQGFLFVDRFDEFEYDEVNHCYIAENYDIGEIDYEYIKIFIERGRIVRMEAQNVYAEAVEGSVTSDGFVAVFSNYGTTVIEGIPDEWTPAP